MSDSPQQLHHIALFVDKYGVRAKFDCTGDENAACHQYTDCTCEDGWDSSAGPVINELPEGDNCKHPKASHEECWMKDWFEACDPFELYDGPNDSLVASVPIDAHFDGDSVIWKAAS